MGIKPKGGRKNRKHGRNRRKAERRRKRGYALKQDSWKGLGAIEREIRERREARYEDRG